MSRRVLRGLSTAALLGACLEPSYVSLGRNQQPVESNPEPADPCSGAEAATDDLLLSGCEPAPEPPVCRFDSLPAVVESACDERRSVDCPAVYSTDAENLGGLLTDLLRTCSIRDHALVVQFDAGCATAFTFSPPDSPGGDVAAACVAARLAGERYACAVALECGIGSVRSIPTSSVSLDWY